jgi:hypothetical protein
VFVSLSPSGAFSPGLIDLQDHHGPSSIRAEPWEFLETDLVVRQESMSHRVTTAHVRLRGTAGACSDSE